MTAATAATATAAEAGSPIGIACWARGTAQTTAQVNSIYIDNVTAVEAQFGFGALYPVTGAKLSVGKSASIRVVMNSVLPITGNQVYSAYCDNPAVAALSSTGVVTAIGVGKANVHVLADGVDHVFPIFVS